MPAGTTNFQYTVTTLGRLTEPQQFADIIVKTGSDGRITSSPVVADGRLYATSEDGTLRAYANNAGLAPVRRPDPASLVPDFSLRPTG